MGESEVLDIGRRSLNIAGMRVGDQRSLIIDIIRHGEGHLDADEIYRRAHERDVGGVDKSIVVCYTQSGKWNPLAIMNRGMPLKPGGFEVIETEIRVSGYCVECRRGKG